MAVTAALAVTALLGALVWRSDRLGRVDAWAMREIPAHSHGYEGFVVASLISDTLGPLLIGVVVALAVLTWSRLRRDALLLSLLAPPATLAAEMALKHLVGRRSLDGDTLMYPSGHLAVATAVTVTLLLVVGAGIGSARRRRTVIALAVTFILVAAWASLAETAHSLSDVVGGIATGTAVALGSAVALPWARAASKVIWPGRATVERRSPMTWKGNTDG